MVCSKTLSRRDDNLPEREQKGERENRLMVSRPKYKKTNIYGFFDKLRYIAYC